MPFHAGPAAEALTRAEVQHMAPDLATHLHHAAMAGILVGQGYSPAAVFPIMRRWREAGAVPTALDRLADQVARTELRCALPDVDRHIHEAALAGALTGAGYGPSQALAAARRQVAGPAPGEHRRAHRGPRVAAGSL